MNEMKYYAIVFLGIYNEKIIDQILNIDQVHYLSIIYKNTYYYSLNDLIKYLEPKTTKYRWKVHSIVRDIDDGEIVDTVLDTNYNQSNTNQLIICKKPQLLSSDFTSKATEIISQTKYSSELFGAISSKNPYDLFCTSMSIYLANDKNRDYDILSKIKSLDRKIYEV